MNLFSRCALQIVVGLFVSQTVCGQVQWQIPKLSGNIVFDGKPDEAIWDSIEAFPFITLHPAYGKPAEQKTVIKLAFDDQNIYLGAELYTDGPDMIRAIGKVRDFSSMSCDWMGFQLDTYNDNQNSVVFLTNPNGIRWDATVSNDGTPGNTEPMDLNWNTFWEVKTVVEDRVWFAEMKVPLSSLRFESKNGATVMGFNVLRYLPVTNEVYIFPDTPNNWGSYSQIKPSTYADGIFEGIEPRKPLYISPYVLSGLEQSNVLNDDGTAYTYKPEFKLEPGLDVKYGLNSNTTLDLTINTDFAQVEADAQQFNLTRFSLVYPEKRKFFLERANVFDFNMGGPNSLFYSRRIGLYDGNPVRILGGARLMSSINGWDIGLMDLQTAAYAELPSENFAVFRIKKNLLNPSSYAGAMLNSRIGVDGTYNTAYGLDALLNLFGDEFLTIRWAQTFDDGVDNGKGLFDPARIYLDWTRRKNKGLSYTLVYVWSGVDFDPGMGLEVFDDYYVYQAQLKYTIIPKEESSLQTHYFSLLTYTINDVRDNKLLTYYLAPGWTFTGKKGWNGTMNVEYNMETLITDFNITDSVSIPVGSYNFSDAMLSLSSPGTRSFHFTVTLCSGQYYDGYRFSPQVNPTWNISSGVELGATYLIDYLDFSSRDQLLQNHIFGLRGLYMLNTRLSFSGFVQYNTAINRVISNLRLRYNPKEGTDLYLVFNEGRNTYLDRETPALPSYSNRSVLLKFTYTFNL